MGNDILFSERQKYSQWWIWLIILLLNGVFLFVVYTEIAKANRFGNSLMNNPGLLLAAVSTFLPTILFSIFRLETQVKEDGIYARFFPLHLSFKHYSWDKINKLYVREYRPIGEYGGWGLRMGGKSGKAFNVSGNMGLQIEFTDNKKLLIGTNKPEELTEALKKIGQIKN